MGLMADLDKKLCLINENNFFFFFWVKIQPLLVIMVNPKIIGSKIINNTS